jgi:hypothetical protein
MKELESVDSLSHVTVRLAAMFKSSILDVFPGPIYSSNDADVGAMMTDIFTAWGKYLLIILVVILRTNIPIHLL